jgi:hypothetical protein
VLCVLDISLCDCGCDHGLIFHKNNSRSDYVFNSGIIVRSGELQEILDLYSNFYRMQKMAHEVTMDNI